MYEKKVAAERTWGGGFFSKKVRITSSQILQMTFGLGNLQPTHARLVAYFLGFVNDEFRPTQSAANRPLPEDDRSIVELKYFFSVAALAGVNNVPMLVDA